MIIGPLDEFLLKNTKMDDNYEKIHYFITQELNFRTSCLEVSALVSSKCHTYCLFYNDMPHTRCVPQQMGAEIITLAFHFICRNRTTTRQTVHK